MSVYLFSKDFHRMESGYRKRELLSMLMEIAKSQGLSVPASPSPTVYTDEEVSRSLPEAGDVVVCRSLIDLGELAELGAVIRSWLSRGVRIVCSESSDLVSSIRVIEALATAYAGLEAENAKLKAAQRDEAEIARQIGGAISAELAGDLERVLTGFNQSMMGRSWGDEFLKKRVAAMRKQKAEGEKSDV